MLDTATADLGDGSATEPISDLSRAALWVDDLWEESGIGTFGHHVLGGLEQLGHVVHRLSPSVGAWQNLTPARPALLAAALRRSDATTFFSPGFYPPIGWSGPKIVTVHDLQYLDPRVTPNAAKRLYFRRLLVPALARCDALLTVSAESAEALRAHVPGNPDITVVGEGIESAFFNARRDRAQGETFRVIYVGNWLSHKRVDVIIRACAAAAVAGRRIELSLPGQPPAAMATLLRETASATFGIHLRDRLGVADLAAEIASHDLLVLASRTEGFGLTPLEAQAAGVPVLVSDFAGARSRFGRDAAHYVDPLAEPAALARRITSLAHDEAELTSTIGAGLQNANRHQWTDVADRVSRVLARVAR